MFQQLVPLLRQRSVLLTVASLEDDQIRVNVMPKKLKEGENSALTTPMSFTGTADELDAQLPDAIVSFVASHLELKNTLARAKEEMDSAAKAAQEEARNKAKNNKKPVIEPAKKAEPTPKEEPKKEPEPPSACRVSSTPQRTPRHRRRHRWHRPPPSRRLRALPTMGTVKRRTSWQRSRTATTMTTPMMKKRTKPPKVFIVKGPLAQNLTLRAMQHIAFTSKHRPR
jgi:PRTRC genetic system protein E